MIVGAGGRLRVTTADAVFVISARLVPVTVTVWLEAIRAGAVYRPAAEMVPTFGLMLHAVADYSLSPWN